MYLISTRQLCVVTSLVSQGEESFFVQLHIGEQLLPAPADSSSYLPAPGHFVSHSSIFDQPFNQAKSQST